jgi:hypothetical protein
MLLDRSQADGDAVMGAMALAMRSQASTSHDDPSSSVAAERDLARTTVLLEGAGGATLERLSDARTTITEQDGARARAVLHRSVRELSHFGAAGGLRAPAGHRRASDRRGLRGHQLRGRNDAARRRAVSLLGWPYLPGKEIAGAVREFGAAVTDLEVGQRAAAFLPGGGGFSPVAVAPRSLATGRLTVAVNELASLAEIPAVHQLLADG